MKKLLLLTTVSLLLIFAACKKETTVTYTANTQITGYWPALYGYGTAVPTSACSVLFRADGTMRIYIGADSAAAVKGEGVYNISEGKLVFWYKHLTDAGEYTFASVLADKTFTGTWGNGQLSSGAGLFSMTIK